MVEGTGDLPEPATIVEKRRTSCGLLVRTDDQITDSPSRVAPTVADRGHELLCDAGDGLGSVGVDEPEQAEQRGHVWKGARREELGDLRLGIRPRREPPINLEHGRLPVSHGAVALLAFEEAGGGLGIGERLAARLGDPARTLPFEALAVAECTHQARAEFRVVNRIDEDAAPGVRLDHGQHAGIARRAAPTASMSW